MEPVNTIILFIDSTCSIVMYCSRFISLRATIINVNTIAKPEKIAPATKYGGKMVVCQPGITEVAKSKDTIVCTESTSGVERPASTRDRASCRCQCLVEPVQPKASTPYMALRHFSLARSRTVAITGIRPEYQKSSETGK